MEPPRTHGARGHLSVAPSWFSGRILPNENKLISHNAIEIQVLTKDNLSTHLMTTSPHFSRDLSWEL